MGRYPRRRPERLGEKLLQIRHALELSQDGMLSRLGLSEERFRSAVSSYELGHSEPELPSLLIYARLVGIPVDVLIDNDLELPRAVRIAAQRRSGVAKKRRSKK